METKLIVSWLYDKAARAHDHSYARMLNMTAKRLRELDEKQRWIPVSERLPECFCGVLVWTPHNKNIYCAYINARKEWRFFDETTAGALIKTAVTHWMPLPEPPKEVAE